MRFLATVVLGKQISKSKLINLYCIRKGFLCMLFMWKSFIVTASGFSNPLVGLFSKLFKCFNGLC